MTMNPDKRRRDIGQLLAQLLPIQVLKDVRNLALEFEQEEFLRRYALKRMWLIIPAALVFAIVSTACAVAVIALSLRLLEQSIPQWAFYLTLGMAAATWFGSLLLQLYLLFSWLERAALRQLSPRKNPEGTPWASTVSSTRRSNALPLLLLIGIFIVVPLVAAAMIWPSFAFTLLAVLLLAPILVTLFDR